MTFFPVSVGNAGEIQDVNCALRRQTQDISPATVLTFFRNANAQKVVDEVFSCLVDQTVLVGVPRVLWRSSEVNRNIEIDACSKLFGSFIRYVFILRHFFALDSGHFALLVAHTKVNIVDAEGSFQQSAFQKSQFGKVLPHLIFIVGRVVWEHKL